MTVGNTDMGDKILNGLLICVGLHSVSWWNSWERGLNGVHLRRPMFGAMIWSVVVGWKGLNTTFNCSMYLTAATERNGLLLSGDSGQS